MLSSFSPRVLVVVAAVLAAPVEPVQEQAHPAVVEMGEVEPVGVGRAEGAGVEMETFLVFQKILHHLF